MLFLFFQQISNHNTLRTVKGLAINTVQLQIQTQQKLATRAAKHDNKQTRKHIST